MIALTALLLSLDLEALAALLWAFLTPSEIGQGVFFWLSRDRLLLVALLTGILVALLLCTAQLWRSRAGIERGLTALDRRLIHDRELAPVLLGLILAGLLIPAATLVVASTPLRYEAYAPLAPDTFPLLHALVTGGLPLILLVVVACFEAVAFLLLRYRRLAFTRDLWAPKIIAPALLLSTILALTAFHWLTLIFRLRFFVNLPAWYWIFDPLPFGPGDLWFAVIAIILLVRAYWLLIVKRRLAGGLALVAALGWFLQIGVGLMGGGGLQTLRDRYFSTYHQAYVVKAAQSDLTVLDGIRRYDEVFGSSAFTSTKPPGLMAFYMSLDHVINGFPSAFDQSTRYERLSNAVTWLFPVLALAAPLLLFAFARRWLDDPSGMIQRLSPLLYVLVPSAALFTFFPDQALYPIIFLLGTWFAVVAIRRRSFAWAFLLGAVMYVAAFFAFSMLPLYPFAAIYLVLHHWRERSESRLRSIALGALAIAAGTLLLHLGSVAVLDYNFLPRFERTMSINHNFDFYLRVGQQPPVGSEPPLVRLGQVVGAGWLNNLDFAAAVGFPVYILFFVQAVRRIGRFILGRLGSGDIILLALLASFAVLNLAGTAQGEVPRLWLFWLPLVVLLAACEMEPHVEKRPGWVLALGLVQLITTMLTFHFQDLKM